MTTTANGSQPGNISDGLVSMATSSPSGNSQGFDPPSVGTQGTDPRGSNARGSSAQASDVTKVGASSSGAATQVVASENRPASKATVSRSVWYWGGGFGGLGLMIAFVAMVVRSVLRN
jgi:hypothetical protein